MRLLLLIMTGIGFTLDLLCGLLLQLPADGLPANNNDNAISDASYRSRRSFSDDSVVENSQPNSVHGAESARPAGKQAFQPPTNPEIGSNPFVSGVGAGHNGDPQSGSDNGQALSQAEPSGQSVNGERGGPAEKAGEGYEHKTPVPPTGQVPVTKPVTSFSLRLKNTGEKFVVDSAVKRQREEDTHVDQPAPVEGAPAEGHSDPEIQTNTHPHQVDPHNTKLTPSSKTLQHHNKTSPLNDIVSGVLWSKHLDDSCPHSNGLEPKELASWRRKAAGMQVVGVEEGCGRMQNRLVTFKDGSKACARYRLNTDQIQGEVYSYYLARLLNITNLPPAVLLPVDTLSPQWRTVHLEMSMAQWADGRLVVLTRWLDNLNPSYIPQELREEDRKLHPTVDVLGKKNAQELCDLLQWSDLIVFDYLTANLDRLVNNMFNRQWNAEMMNNPAHNLERTKDGSLVFLDNESGLFHGYRLLEKYHSYHESLLNSVCVFRESTAKAVKVLHESKSVGEELHKLFTEGEVHHRHLPSIPEKNASVLKDRLARVYDQIVKCEKMYGHR
ncbi:four-jointed box protein 1-like [Littorina saxatilis]|uniref:Uncharacterized protein n=1 Tax=Littorina saxatilis TaxID=31220 RepID=A0AAN9BJR4_9CAEN